MMQTGQLTYFILLGEWCNPSRANQNQSFFRIYMDAVGEKVMFFLSYSGIKDEPGTAWKIKKELRDRGSREINRESNSYCLKTLETAMTVSHHLDIPWIGKDKFTYPDINLFKWFELGLCHSKQKFSVMWYMALLNISFVFNSPFPKFPRNVSPVAPTAFLILNLSDFFSICSLNVDISQYLLFSFHRLSLDKISKSIVYSPFASVMFEPCL